MVLPEQFICCWLQWLSLFSWKSYRKVFFLYLALFLYREWQGKETDDYEIIILSSVIVRPIVEEYLKFMVEYLIQRLSRETGG